MKTAKFNGNYSALEPGHIDVQPKVKQLQLVSYYETFAYEGKYHFFFDFDCISKKEQKNILEPNLTNCSPLPLVSWRKQWRLSLTTITHFCN
jgi:hypothetical protein